jgi:hypothetical protein
MGDTRTAATNRPDTRREWLRKQNATLCCATGTCTLNTGTKTRTLSLADDELPQTDDQVLHLLLATMLAAHLPPAIIAMKQAKKATAGQDGSRLDARVCDNNSGGLS